MTRAETFSRIDKQYREMGYSCRWKQSDKWRSTWGIFGIKVQIMEIKISYPPESMPGLITRWKTVFTF